MSSIIDIATTNSVETYIVTSSVRFSDSSNLVESEIVPSVQDAVSMTASGSVEGVTKKTWKNDKKMTEELDSVTKTPDPTFLWGGNKSAEKNPWLTKGGKSLKENTNVSKGDNTSIRFVDQTKANSFIKSYSNKIDRNDNKTRIQPLDIAEEWVNSENDECLWNAKKTFLGFCKRNLKHQNYTDVHRGYNIIEYLSKDSQKFFRMVADHVDLKNNKIARLYEWKINGKLVHILAIDDVDSLTNTWLQNRKDFYNDVARKGQIDGVGFDKKSYSILRRNCLKDFANKFTSTWFFKDFDSAKRAITMKVDGHVQFLKKEFLKPTGDDESDEILAELTEQIAEEEGHTDVESLTE